MAGHASDPNFEARVRASFLKQGLMRHLGVEVVHVAPGEVDLAVAFRPELSQQHGFFHAGVTSAIADSAAGYAALTLFGAGTGVLTTEFKINLLNPAKGGRLVAEGRVLKAGRTLSVCRSDVFALDGDIRKQVATALLTMMQVSGVTD
ncbi:MAG: PaaI family thioesterase [Parvibaculaceae bacterium]